jgi:hypothetical protein
MRTPFRCHLDPTSNCPVLYLFLVIAHLGTTCSLRSALNSWPPLEPLPRPDSAVNPARPGGASGLLSDDALPPSPLGLARLPKTALHHVQRAFSQRLLTPHMKSRSLAILREIHQGTALPPAARRRRAQVIGRGRRNCRASVGPAGGFCQWRECPGQRTAGQHYGQPSEMSCAVGAWPGAHQSLFCPRFWSW